MQDIIHLETIRLQIRDLSSSDVGSIHRLHSHPDTDKYNTLGVPENIQTTEHIVAEWLECQHSIPRMSYIFGIYLKESNQFIGLIALNLREPKYQSAEIWFKLSPSFWRMGYATEALREMLRFGLSDLNLHRIEAGCAIENTASIRLLEKVGMTREGMKRKNLPIRSEWVDAYSYGMLAGETIFQ